MKAIQRIWNLGKRLRPDFPQDNMIEASVIYTDHTVNLMNTDFITKMAKCNQMLRQTFNTYSSILMPGSGTFGMESIIRQFAPNQKCLFIRNGYFSYRWEEVCHQADICDLEQLVTLKGSIVYHNNLPVVYPVETKTILEKIDDWKPNIVFLPHVETSNGLKTSDLTIKQVAEKVHDYGGFVCLDGVASGIIPVNLKKLGVDIYLTAPQKGLSSSAGLAIILLSEHAESLYT